MATPEIHNFSAGPAVLPASVLQKAQSELLNFANSGSSVMEFSHRGVHFEGILAAAEATFRSLLKIPDNYKVLFMQGGATAQFSAIVYNLVGSNPGDLKSKTVDYVVTGSWSEKGVKEAKHMGANVNVVVNTKKSNHNGEIPAESEWKFTKDASFVCYCDNETIHGVEFGANGSGVAEFPFHLVPEGVPVVCDMSSNILARPVDISKYGCIFAGAQKNMGPSGVTLVILREDLFDRATVDLPIPTILDYKIYRDNNSMYNTPPTYSIYICGLVFKWLQNEMGGLEGMKVVNERKSKLLYDMFDGSGGAYSCPVVKQYRSNMNVPFRVCKDGKPDEALEKKFLKGAEEKGMVQLKGHRSVGGLRASLYNALQEKSVLALCNFPLVPNQLDTDIHINSHFDDVDYSSQNNSSSSSVTNSNNPKKRHSRMESNNSEEKFEENIEVELDNVFSFIEKISETSNNKRANFQKVKKNQKKAKQSQLVFTNEGLSVEVLDSDPTRRTPSNIYEGIIPQLQSLLVSNNFYSLPPTARKRLEFTSAAILCDPSILFVKSEKSDARWGCGYRNCQMMLSTLLAHNDTKSIIHSRINSNLEARNANDDIPSVVDIQNLIEKAWAVGFDRAGSSLLKGTVKPSKWIGATEISSVLKLLGVRNHVADFWDKESSSMLLIDYVQQYFGGFNHDSGVLIKSKPPLYLQHQGHSRTIVGIERTLEGDLKLLLFDPGRTIPNDLDKNMQDAPAGLSGQERSQYANRLLSNVFRADANVGLKKPQYQVVRIFGCDETGWSDCYLTDDELQQKRDDIEWREITCVKYPCSRLCSMQFLKRKDSQIIDANNTLKFFSYNVPNLHVIEDDNWKRVDPWEQEDAFMAVKQTGPKANVISIRKPDDIETINRHITNATSPLTSTIPVSNTSIPLYLDQNLFKDMDNLLALANKYQIRVIIPFIDRWDWMGGIESFANFFKSTHSTNSTPIEHFYTNPEIKSCFFAVVTAIMQRNNTVTGVRYCDDPAIIWETGNELELPSKNSGPPSDWTIEFAQLIKNLSNGKQLVIDGTYGRKGWDAAVLTNPNIDILSNHYYPELETKDVIYVSICVAIFVIALILMLIAIFRSAILPWIPKISSNSSKQVMIDDGSSVDEVATTTNKNFSLNARTVSIIVPALCMAISLGFFLYVALSAMYRPALDKRLRDDVRLIKKYGKPLLVGEVGLTNVNTLENFYKEVDNNSEVVGSLFWSLRFRSVNGGFYTHREYVNHFSYHFPGLPGNSTYMFPDDSKTMITLLRKYASNTTSPIPLPVPLPPTFIPERCFSITPEGSEKPVVGLTWRGSVGAEWYTIEKSRNGTSEYKVVDERVFESAFNATVKLKTGSFVKEAGWVDYNVERGTCNYRIAAKNNGAASNGTMITQSSAYSKEVTVII
ncbi:Phosphoserine aminotransferase [Nowakowskiella sp. JEL0407]|nr:Phosphoserine aminotransferase [Nowakowskiella sp. JEL0407]